MCVQRPGPDGVAPVSDAFTPNVSGGSKSTFESPCVVCMRFVVFAAVLLRLICQPCAEAVVPFFEMIGKSKVCGHALNQKLIVKGPPEKLKSVFELPLPTAPTCT